MSGHRLARVHTAGGLHSDAWEWLKSVPEQRAEHAVHRGRPTARRWDRVLSVAALSPGLAVGAWVSRQYLQISGFLPVGFFIFFNTMCLILFF